MSGVTSVLNRREILYFAAWSEVLEGKPGKELVYFLSGCYVEIPWVWVVGVGGCGWVSVSLHVCVPNPPLL